jgi:hypothetical protein
MIYFDPTESRRGTRLPETVIAQGHDLPGLEAVTGADLLITTEPISGTLSVLADVDADKLRFITTHFHEYPDPVLPNVASAVQLPLPAILTARRLFVSVQNGLLVQRKTGSDLLNLIPNYSRILMKMLIWTNRPWLLFIGTLKAKDDYALIDRRKSKFHYNSMIGCLEAWQEGFQGHGGGFYTQLSSDDLIAPWLSRRLNKLRSATKAHLVPARAALRPVIGEKRPWVQTLATFPGIGPEKARALADHWETLAGCLEYLSDDTLWKQEKVVGVSKGTVAQARIHLGFEGDRSLRLVVEAKGE